MKSIRILLACLRKADEMYNLIANNDKIILGLSGGKDSIALLYTLHLYQKFSHKKFKLQPVTLDLGFDNFNGEILKNYCTSLGYNLIIEDAREVYKILKKNMEDNNLKHLPCSICSKMKKAAINKVANELGYNKVAFAHHADDAIETLFMNMSVGARIATFAPKMHLERANITFIRPFIHAFEKDISSLIKEESLPVLGKICPADKLTNREMMKETLLKLYKSYDKSHENFLTMLFNYEKEELFAKDIYYQIDQNNLTLKPVISSNDKAKEMYIRKEVFMREQNISPNAEIEIADELKASSFLIYKKDQPIGTIRYLKIDEDTYKIGRFAILKKYRHKGYGLKALNYLVNCINKKYYPKNIIVYAQKRSMAIYEKASFVPYDRPFKEAKIVHIKMRYENEKK